jgi:hypothetical protein
MATTMTEYERNALRAIERELIDSDPAFAARMTARDPADRPFPVLSALGALAYIFLPIEAVLFGWASALTTLAVIMVITASVLIGRFVRRGGR